MSDNYEFMKTSEAQDATDYSPYVDKQYNNYIKDINNGVSTNNSLTFVNFDLGQIYNSQKFTETSELFAVLPIAIVTTKAIGIFDRYSSSSCVSSNQ
jgi:DNA helicase IV